MSYKVRHGKLVRESKPKSATYTQAMRVMLKCEQLFGPPADELEGYTVEQLDEAETLLRWEDAFNGRSNSVHA
ncbi:hypothetical protein [Bradyrhizobium sp. STM 3809]|uniref:hypothetical protein n=1 Tax=Bradyrhizobium sp. STM 3809 TaxID=551936 RepID=UPI0002406ADB|nr:hypothetical protein [Bradyrhizobium sp. STM 3809]CCD97642.1 hypothetical protein BRAS3809_1160024 [Bradyrhizobium sp. STM 3809]